nr:Cna B-type domain-containing protein [Lachnospiraceae bacterium]
MKKRKTKLWKKVLVGFMSFTMFLGNLSSLSIEAFAATEDVLDYEEGADQFAEEIDEEVIPEEPITEDAIDEGIENPDDQFGEFGYEYAESEEEEYEEIAYYTVTYYDVDGSLLGSTEFAEGSALSMPQTGEGAYWTDEAGTEYFEGDAVYDNLSLFVNVDDIDLEEEIEEAEELAEGQILVNAVLADDEGNVLDSFRITSDMYLNPDDDNDAPEIEGYEFVSAMIDQSAVSEILVTETEEGLLEYTVDGVVLEADADIVLNYESTEFKYNISIQIVDEDGRVIEGYENAELPEIDGTLDLADVQNAPVEVEGYDYVGASIGEENVYSVTVEAGDGYYETDNGFTDIESDITIKLNYAEASVAVVLKATIVDEFGDEIDGQYTEMEMPEFDADGILTLDDPELPPVEDVKVKTGIIRSVKYTYVRTTINGNIVSAIKAEDAVGGLGTYYSYTADGETWIKIKEDTTVLFEYTDGKKTTYTYSDGMVSVTATLQHANAVPDDAYFAVTPLTAGSGYDVDSYIDALNAKGATPEGDEEFRYTTSNTLLYDIAFYTDETMTEEIEPADGMVKTEIVFLQNQLKDELNADDQSELIINHLSIDEAALEEAGTLANADVSVGSINVETIQADISVASESMAFMTDSYSIVTITQPNVQIKYIEGTTSLESILGEAANFGIVADSYIQSGDTQTNMAVNLFTSDADIGSDLSNDPGTMYVGTIGNVLKVKSGSVVYYGDQNDSNKITFVSGGESGVSLPMSADEIAELVDSLISNVAASVPDAGDMMNVLPAQNDMNHYTLDLSALPDNATVHIDLDGKYGEGNNGIYDVIVQNAGLNVKKTPGQTIIFHSSRSDVHLRPLNIWNGSGYVQTAAGAGTEFLDAQTRGIIFDLRSASHVHLDNAMAGVFIAPNATVDVDGGACSGWLIANKVVGKTEWHFVNQNVPKPTIKDDNCKLELTITKHLIDDDTKKPADPSLWPEEGFNIKVSKYPCDADGDINRDMGVATDPANIPDLTGMVNGEITVNIKKEQADQKVLVGTADFVGSDVWNRGYEYRDRNGKLLNKYIVFMYKVEEQECSDPNYTIDEKTYYVKYFINCKQIQNGNDIKYYVWVDGPHVANIVTDPNACQPIDIELTNHVRMPELTDIPVSKVWADLNDVSDAHSNDTVLIQLTKKSGDEYVDVEGKTIELPQNNSWSGVFEDLPKTDANGDEIEYSAREVSVNGVDVTTEDGVRSVVINNRTYVVSDAVKGSDGSLTITNTPNGKGRLVVSKSFINVLRAEADGAYNNITFNVYREGDDPATAEPVAVMRREYENKHTIYKADDLEFGNYFIVESGTKFNDNKVLANVTCSFNNNGTEAELPVQIFGGAEVSEAYAGAPVAVTGVFTFSANKQMVSFVNEYSEKHNLRIHKIVVNDFGSDTVNGVLDNVVFRIGNDSGYIIMQGFRGQNKSTSTATGYGSFAGQTFTVEYNGNAQWTILDIPAGTYEVREVADGITFTYDVSTDTSTDLADREWSRVTHYDVTADAETENDGSESSTNIKNARLQAAAFVGQGTSPAIVTVGDDSVGNASHTPTAQICNYYSKPAATMNVSKEYEGWDADDSGKTFSFSIAATSTDATDSAGNTASIPMPENTTVSVSSEASSASFGTVNYQYEGSYYYTITEDIPEGANLITRDGKSYYLASDGILYDAQTVYVKVDVGQFDSTFKKTYTNLGEYDET